MENVLHQNSKEKAPKKEVTEYLQQQTARKTPLQTNARQGIHRRRATKKPTLKSARQKPR